MKYQTKKNQGEIFGIALFFVIIIVGVILYGRIAAVRNLDEDLTQQEEKYKLLAEGTLNSLLKISTGCTVERDKDTLKDLINFCLDTSDPAADPEIVCDGTTRRSCTYSLQILEGSLLSLYNTSDNIGVIPYNLSVKLPDFPQSSLNAEFNNFDTFNITSNIDRRKKGYKKAPSGRISWATSRRNVNFELYLFYN